MRKQILFMLMLLPALLIANTSETLDKVVAVVNDEVITASELNAEVDKLRQQLLARNTALPAQKILEKQVLHHLIDVDLQMQLAKKNNITVDNTELNEAISTIAKKNNLSLTQLREEMTKHGVNWEIYRDNIRKEMLIHQVQQKAIAKDVVVSSQLIDDYVKTWRNNNKSELTYHLQNIVIPVSEEPTTQQLKKARQKAQSILEKAKKEDDFSRLALAESSDEHALEGGDLGERHLAEWPEVFAQKVVDMKVGEIAGPIRTGNGYQLIKLIAVGGDNERHEVTKTHVRHILLKQAANMTEDEALRQVNNIHQQLKSGKPFSTMAKQYSLDAASAVNGGDLGWVTDEGLVPEFVEVMNQLPLNKVSQPVKSPFGWHLIEVLARKKVDDSQAYQRQKAHQYLYQRKFAEAVENWQQQIRVDAYVKILDQNLA